jgi:ribosome assembly protein YihI (activator of Der GTPase)
MTNTDTLQDFEKLIVDHWHNLNEYSIEPIDFLDSVLDFLTKYPNIDPEDLKFSDAFVDRIKIDAIHRKLLDKSDREKREDEEQKNINELEI